MVQIFVQLHALFTGKQSMYILIVVVLLFNRTPVNVAQDTLLFTLLKKNVAYRHMYMFE